MSLKVCVLASGSGGNCIYVASGETSILIDAGLSCRETLKRIEMIGADPARINAICITHEHDDHISSLGALHRKTGADLYGNSGTIEGIGHTGKHEDLPWKVFGTGVPFQVGDLRIEPFSVSHDTYDPVGFAITNADARIGIVTDMGIVTELVRTRLKNCRILVIESNHEDSMLKNSDRPWVLKQRIAGMQGHLSNEQACQLLGDIAGPDLRAVFLAHLSSECNEPELAVKSAKAVLEKRGFPGVAVKLTYDNRASDVAEC